MQIAAPVAAQKASAQKASANGLKKWHNPALNPHLLRRRQAIQPQGRPQTSRRQAVKPARLLPTPQQAKVTRADRGVPTMTPERSDAASAKRHCKPKAFYQNSSAETDGVRLNLELDTKASEYIPPDGIGEF